MREAGDVLEAEREAELRREHDGHFLINRADEITFTTHVVTRSEVAHRFAQLEVFKDLCSDLIGPGAILYWDQLVYKKPETDEEFPWHQDNGYTFVSPEAYLTCWVPLTEATEENGCPWVILGPPFGTLNIGPLHLVFSALVQAMSSPIHLPLSKQVLETLWCFPSRRIEPAQTLRTPAGKHLYCSTRLAAR